MSQHQIRIVGGQYRGRRIRVPTVAGLRPTPDRVRETLFNWLQHLWAGDFSQRRVLDLYAGTGALGFEAASRGAAQVMLVDRDPHAVSAMRHLASTLQAGMVEIVRADAAAYLKRQTGQGFDLILLDPPYGADHIGRLLPNLGNALLPQGLVYLETGRQDPPVQEHHPQCAHWDTVRQLCTGQTRVQLLRFAATQKNKNNADTDDAVPAFAASSTITPESA